MSEFRIFISYRRSDSEVITGRIHDRLVNHFGDESVFMDIDNIPFGIDFRNHLNNAVVQADVVLAVIGNQWHAQNEAGMSRLQDPSDFVRIELESALAQNIPVIPLLIGGTSMPDPDSLPDSLLPLVYRNAAPIDTSRDFHNHMDRLIHSLDQHFERNKVSFYSKISENERTGKSLKLILTGVVVFLLASVVIHFWDTSNPRRSQWIYGGPPETNSQ